MNSYPTYKASGIEWLGDIPEHWNSISLKHLLEVKDGTHDTPAYIDNISEGYPLVTSKDVSNGELDFEKCKYISSEDYIEINNRSNVEYGDLIMPMIGTIGSPIKVKTQRPFSIKNLALFKNNKLVNVDYLCYVIGSNLVETQFDLQSSGGVQGFVALDTLRNLKVFKISFIEQTAIANYLDDKTSKLDQLIKNKKAQIAQLKEIRQIEINTAVTKGLNPTAKLKPSGIAWLDDTSTTLSAGIPEHWEVRRVKDVANVVLGKMLQNNNTGDDKLKPYLRSLNVQWEKVRIDDVKEMWLSDYERTVYRVKYNDILVSEGGEFGRSSIWKDEIEECYIQNSVHKITCKSNMNSHLLLYQFVFAGHIGHFDKIVNRVSIGHLTREKLVSVHLAVPPKEEQTAIANYLDEKTSKIDHLVSNLENQIAQLQELRKIEIFNAVTGKIKVA